MVKKSGDSIEIMMKANDSLRSSLKFLRWFKVLCLLVALIKNHKSATEPKRNKALRLLCMFCVCIKRGWGLSMNDYNNTSSFIVCFELFFSFDGLWVSLNVGLCVPSVEFVHFTECHVETKADFVEISELIEMNGGICYCSFFSFSFSNSVMQIAW